MAQQDAIALLDADHQKVDQLFNEYRGAAPDRKQAIARTLCQELAVHTTIEEEIFYPAFARATGDRQLVGHAEKEHQEAKDLVAQLEARGADDALVAKLQKAVQHHVQEEREKMFPQARQSGMDVAAVGRQLAERKSDLVPAHSA